MPELKSAIMQARGLTEDDASLLLLSSAGLTVGDWQAARVELGIGPWAFAASVAPFLSKLKGCLLLV